MSALYFSVYGAPEGKGRPRLSAHSGFARAYTPKKTREYEEKIKAAAEKSLREFPAHSSPFFAENAVTVRIRAVYPIPASWSAKKKSAALSGQTAPCVKPDADNVAKIICDALNGLAYADDKQVITLEFFKEYGEVPRVIVAVEACGK